MTGRPGRLVARMVRIARMVAGALLLLALGAAPAAADPAGPTDYRSEVTGLVPPTDQVRVQVIGGDSFLRLTATPGTTVQVIGYRGEPYLQIEADGTVQRNERSPTRWLNDNRYGAVNLPASADPGAPPQWLTVGHGGHYAWHDHRSHWMSPVPPPASRPGQVVLEAEVPLLVNGNPVAVEVRSTRLAPPSVWPTLTGVLLAAAVVAAAVVGGSRRSQATTPAVGVAVAAWSALAVVVGWWGYRSVPAETGPSILGWAPPLAALVLSAGAAWWARTPSRGPQALTAAILLGSAGLELGWWAWLQRVSLWRALIPTAAPADLHRVAAAGAAVAAIAAVAAALALTRPPRPAPRPVRAPDRLPA